MTQEKPRSLIKRNHKKQKQILELKNAMNEMKQCNREHQHHNKSNRRICELEDRNSEIILLEKKR